MTLHIDLIAGFCPVQAEGTIDGKPFYFKARGQRWTIGVGGDPHGHPSEPEGKRPNWYREERWGDSKFAAGWMSVEEALEIIKRCAAEYAQECAGASPAAGNASEATTGRENKTGATDAPSAIGDGGAV